MVTYLLIGWRHYDVIGWRHRVSRGVIKCKVIQEPHKDYTDVFPSCQEPKELSTSFFWWRPLIEVETSFLPAGLREAQPCRYCFYSLVQKWVFRPAGATRCPDKVEILRSAPLCKISPLLGQKCGNTDPKTVKISNFGHTFALQRLLVWTIFTKFSAFVRVYM